MQQSTTANEEVNLHQQQVQSEPFVAASPTLLEAEQAPNDHSQPAASGDTKIEESTPSCQYEGCTKSATTGTNSCTNGRSVRTQFCPSHAGVRVCHFDGCSKIALTGGLPYCVGHGGGRRCQQEGCTKSAVSGGTPCCVAHGGGKRCQHEDCTKPAPGRQQHCTEHGGGKRCQYEDCTKTAPGRTLHCKAHGGGKRCQHEGCAKSAATGAIAIAM